MKHDVWVEVDLDGLEFNLRQMRSCVGADVRVAAVVKANGYGHGAVESALAFARAGADMLAVTRLEEALPLRDGGVQLPILMLAPSQPDNLDLSVRSGLDHTVSNIHAARALSEAAVATGSIARAQVKIDTGMGRIGAAPDDAVDLFREIAALPALSIVGCYTHFARAADAEAEHTRAQLRAFSQTVSDVRSAGFEPGLVHAANSAATIRFPESRLDMVRVGTLLYGQYPSSHVPRRLSLADAWKLKTRVCEIKSVPAGTNVGYGSEFTARRRSRVAAIPVGWADGFGLIPEGPVYRQSVLHFAARKIRGPIRVELATGSAPVVGRVSMQMTTIDVTELEPVSVGDEVVLTASRTSVSALIPRVYVRSGKYALDEVAT